MTLSRQRTDTLPPEGEVGVVDIGPLRLENGAVLDDVSIAVQRWGELSPARDNVVLVLHALTGDSSIPGWWDGITGPGAPIDTDRWCAVATNVLGGCRGFLCGFFFGDSFGFRGCSGILDCALCLRFLFLLAPCDFGLDALGERFEFGKIVGLQFGHGRGGAAGDGWVVGWREHISAARRPV